MTYTNKNIQDLLSNKDKYNTYEENKIFFTNLDTSYENTIRYFLYYILSNLTEEDKALFALLCKHLEKATNLKYISFDTQNIEHICILIEMVFDENVRYQISIQNINNNKRMTSYILLLWNEKKDDIKDKISTRFYKIFLEFDKYFLKKNKTRNKQYIIIPKDLLNFTSNRDLLDKYRWYYNMIYTLLP
jgi:RNA binding exosome subunit